MHHVSLPNHDDLVADLRLLRQRGLGQLRSYRVPAMHSACSAYAQTDTGEQEPAAVEALLRQAVHRIGGGRSGDAAEYTFGLVQGTKLWSAADRRKAAAKAQGVSVERFRKAYEPQIIQLIAENVVIECRERPAIVNPGVDHHVIHTSAAAPQDDHRLVPLVTVDDAGEFAFSRMFEGAERIDMLSRSLVNLLNQYATRIARIVQQGGAVRAVILAPQPSLGGHLYPLPLNGSGSMVFRRHIASVAGRIQYIESLTAGATGSFEVRTTPFIPQYGMVTSWRSRGGEAKTVVQLNFLYTRTERDRPLICVDARSPWFTIFNDEFESVWAHSQPWMEPAWATALLADTGSDADGDQGGRVND